MSARPRFDEYVSARSPVLLRFAYLLCGDRHLAEDLVQEVLIRAHRRWSAIEAANPDAYLKRALVRAHVSWRRRRASTELAIAAPPDAPGSAAFDDAHASRDEVWALLATLPPTQRAVLVLRYFEDLDDNRIAELVGSTPGAVRVNAHRGLRRLRETLEARAQEAPVGTGLAQRVQEGVAAATRRRRTVIAGIAGVLVLGLLVLAIPLLRPAGPAPEPVDPSPSVSQSGEATPLPTSTLALLPAVQPTGPDFPYAFTWLPPGFSSPHVGVSEELQNISAVFERPDGDSDLRVFVAAEEDWEWEANAFQTVTVNGTPANLRTSNLDITTNPCIGLAWPRDGQWLSIQTCREVDEEDDLSVDDVIRIAEGITSGSTASIPLDSLITAVSLPEGYVVGYWAQTSLQADQGPLGVISVSLMSIPEPFGNPTLTVDGWPALDSDNTLKVLLPDGRQVWVYTQTGGVGDRIAIYRTVTIA